MATSKKAAAHDRAQFARSEQATDAERLAEEIFREYSDLAPSLRRILSADLTDGQRFRALTSFRTALGTPGDPSRDPAYAIAHCGPPGD